MKRHNKYAILALSALRRAAAQAAKKARIGGFQVPIWENGHIVYAVPEMEPEQVTGADGDTSSATSGK